MLILYFFIGLAASVVGAISGIGGGVIIKPLLDSIGSFPVSTINFLSGSTVLAMTIATLLRQKRGGERQIEPLVSSLLALGGILGGMAGNLLFDRLRQVFVHEALIAALQSFILAFLTLGVFIFTLFKEQIRSLRLNSPVPGLASGLLLGFLSSFLGIGGGPINLAVLYLLFGMDTKKAALNSIFIIFCSQSSNLILTLLKGTLPIFDPAVLFLMITGGVLGGVTGVYCSARMTHKQVDKLFCTVLAGIVLLCLSNIIRYVNPY